MSLLKTFTEVRLLIESYKKSNYKKKNGKSLTESEKESKDMKAMSKKTINQNSGNPN